jgi:hypothetical protein
LELLELGTVVVVGLVVAKVRLQGRQIGLLHLLGAALVEAPQVEEAPKPEVESPAAVAEQSHNGLYLQLQLELALAAFVPSMQPGMILRLSAYLAVGLPSLTLEVVHWVVLAKLPR